MIEVYNEGGLLHQINVDEFHERIENNLIQGKPFIWSPDETKFIYIATPKEKKLKNFLETDFDKESDF